MNPSDYPLALWPAAASASATDTDYVILAFTVLTLLLTVPIFIGITWFAIYYREGRAVNREHREARNVKIELSWMLIPFALTLVFFVWGAWIFDTHRHPPANCHARSARSGGSGCGSSSTPEGSGRSTICTCRRASPFVIKMISQDVIHSLYLPALRIQMETLPGRYTELWFNANRPGRPIGSTARSSAARTTPTWTGS